MTVNKYLEAVMNKIELLRRIGSVEQVGGVRAIEINTGELGGDNIAKNGKYVSLAPFDSFSTKLSFSFKSLK